MFGRTCLSFAVLLCSTPLWCQVEPSASGGQATADDDSLMTLPPSVSGSFYSSSVGSEERENTLGGGLLFTAAYDDNVIANVNGSPIGAESYTIEPNIYFNTHTSRLSGSLNYVPGFIFYDPTSDLNQVTQNAVAQFEYRLTPHTTVGVEEGFTQNSTVFSTPYTLQGATISASGADMPGIVIDPYVGQLSDYTSGHVGYQLSRSSMISASGSFSSFQYTGAGPITGFYNSQGGGGTGAYSRRLTRRQYVGASYRYSTTTSSPFPSTTTSQFESAFYSIGIGAGFSLSITGGPEYTTTTSPKVVTTHSWSPSGNLGLGWQRKRAVFAMSYARAVTTGGGLLGSFTMDNASATAGWQFTQRLVGSLNGDYVNTKTATLLAASGNPTGHTVFGGATMQYRLAEHLNLVGQYSRVHNTYGAIMALAEDPNIDRISVSINYDFRRPIGR